MGIEKLRHISISYMSILIHDKYILVLSLVRLLYASGSTVFFCSMFLQSVWLTELFHTHIADKLGISR
jgi:hypothetical protein